MESLNWIEENYWNGIGTVILKVDLPNIELFDWFVLELHSNP